MHSACSQAIDGQSVSAAQVWQEFTGVYVHMFDTHAACLQGSAAQSLAALHISQLACGV
jgi:hypothetical protein